MTAASTSFFRDSLAEWETLLAASPVASLFLTPQWQEVWWENFAGARQLAGFSWPNPDAGAGAGAGAGGDETGAIASLAAQDGSFSFVGSPDTFDYNDFLVRPGLEEPFYRALLERLAEQSCRKLRLDSLIEDSPTLVWLPDLARSRGYEVAVEYEDVTSGIALPDSWEGYLALLSKKDRHELRRKLRRLDTQTDWRFYFVSEPAEVRSRFPEFLSLMRMSRADKDEFMTPERERFFYSMAERMAGLDRLRLFFLELDGAAVAASLCFDYRQARLLYNSGYRPDLAYYSVGLLLHAMCLKDAIEAGLGYFDFLRGPEPYKQHLGGRQKRLFSLVVKRS